MKVYDLIVHWLDISLNTKITIINHVTGDKKEHDEGTKSLDLIENNSDVICFKYIPSEDRAEITIM